MRVDQKTERRTDMAKQQELASTWTKGLELPKASGDQQEYLDCMLSSSAEFDPTVTVGGPRPITAQSR
jgi:hypothetical protein